MMFKIINVDVNTTPLTIIIFSNRDNAQCRRITCEMIFPELICNVFPNDKSFSFKLSIRTPFTLLILSICDCESTKYFFEFLHIQLSSFYVKGPFGPFVNLIRCCRTRFFFHICFCLHVAFRNISLKIFGT